MTEGIIQKIIDKNIYRFAKGYYNLGYYNNAMIFELIDLKKELIEEIKKEIPKASPKGSPPINTIWVNYVLNKLIGDTA